MGATITAVDAISVEYPEPNDSNALRYLTFVRIRNSDGAERLGRGDHDVAGGLPRHREHWSNRCGNSSSARTRCRTSCCWHKLKEDAWWYGHRGGIFSFALSAIDIALWDLKGRMLGHEPDRPARGTAGRRPPGHRIHPRVRRRPAQGGRAPRRLRHRAGLQGLQDRDGQARRLAHRLRGAARHRLRRGAAGAVGSGRLDHDGPRQEDHLDPRRGDRPRQGLRRVRPQVDRGAVRARPQRGARCAARQGRLPHRRR